MIDLLTVGGGYFAAASPTSVLQTYIAPLLLTLSGLAGVVCTIIIVNAGYRYMTSAGNPEQLAGAKHILKNALIGLAIVLAAATITSLLTHAYGLPVEGKSSTLPSLDAIPPKPASNGLVEVLINATTGFLNVILQTIGAPFLNALDFFTAKTPLMVVNTSVFTLWLAMVGISNLLFVIVLALIGFHFMSASSLGFDEIELKHFLPRIGLIFILINSSIFLIDGFIELSNALIRAVNTIPGSSTPWDTLTKIVETTSTQGIAALLIMLAFIVFAIILLVYYLGRLVTLFIGAVLSPLIILIWLVPGFRDFSETAAKTYLTTIFTLFVHVIILTLAASLLSGVATVGNDKLPDTFMALLVGLATIIALLKTQGVMLQFSYVSMGARNSRMLGSQFMNGVSYLGGRGKVAATRTAAGTKHAANSVRHSVHKATNSTQPIRYSKPSSQNVGITKIPAGMKTGTTIEAPNFTNTAASATTPRKRSLKKDTK